MSLLWSRIERNGGSIQGQKQDLERGEPTLPRPPWVADLVAEIRGMGDMMRLREALAVANRDVERLRIDRDRLIRRLHEAETKTAEVEGALVRMMKERKV